MIDPADDAKITDRVANRVEALNAALREAGEAGWTVELNVVDVTTHGDPVRVWAVHGSAEIGPPEPLTDFPGWDLA